MASDTLERGSVFFFYRPRVAGAGTDVRPQGLDEIARSYLVLHPKDQALYRLLVIPRKRLPALDGHEREWAFVERVAHSAEEIDEEFREKAYETETRGPRVRPAARPAGEGVYALVRHDDHTHLAHALELPEAPGPVQQALGIEREANYIVSVKNPQAGGGPAGPVAAYPASLQARFQARRFVAADPPQLLDYEGAQVLLVGAAADTREELGIELHPQRENERTAEIFRELRLSKDEFELEPLFRGRWA